jgi:hypothetical protein
VAAVLIQRKHIAELEQRYIFPRAQKAAKESDQNLQFVFDGSGAETVSRYMSGLLGVTNLARVLYQWSLSVFEDLLWTVGCRVADEEK